MNKRTANSEIRIETRGERFYDIHQQVQNELNNMINKITGEEVDTGLLLLFLMHTSAGLIINENTNTGAREDLITFLKKIAPTGLPEYRHNDEGPDDSPSHMKSIVTAQSLAIPVEQGKIALGTWQGIYLGEYRLDPKVRTIKLKYRAD